MRFFAKYALLFFILASFSMYYFFSPFKKFNNEIFLILMGAGILLAFIESRQFFSFNNIKIFKVVYGVMLINIFYMATFGIETWSMETFNYLLAKISFTVMVVVSISLNPEFYFRKMPKAIGYLLPPLFIIGLFSAQTDELTGRYNFGFGNANVAGPMAALCFTILLLYNDFPRLFRVVGIIIAIIVIFVSGSRASIILLAVAFLLRYKLNLKTITAMLIFSVLSIFMVNSLGFSSNIVERTIQSYDRSTGKFDTHRSTNYEAGIESVKQKLITGHGLNAYKGAAASVTIQQRLGVTDLHGIHNGYISAAKMYGIIFWTFFILIILISSGKLIFKYFRSKDPAVAFHVFLVLGILIMAFVEDYLVGINQILTILFFISASILEYYSFYTVQYYSNELVDINPIENI